MATTRRTTKDFIDLMKHALGKTPDSRHKLIQTFNDAGRALVNDHPWKWRTRNRVGLELVANQPYVVLPEDFGEIVAIDADNSQTLSVVQTSVAEIQRMRAWDQYDALTIYIAFADGYEGPTDEDGVLENRAEIYPTPSAARSDINISYLAKWVDMDEDNADRVPLIPRDWERSLMLFARSFAWDVENRRVPYENEALFGQMGEIKRLKGLDASKQTNHGRPLHNVLSRGRGAYYPHRRIARS